MIKFTDSIFTIFIVAVFLPGFFIYRNISLFQIMAIPIMLIILLMSINKSLLKGFVFKSVDLTLYILLSLSLATIFWSTNKAVILDEIFRFFIAITIYFTTQLFIFILSKYKDIEKTIIKLNKVIFFMGLVLAMSVIVDALNLINFHRFVGWKAEYRSVGLLGRPNFGAGILNICLAFIAPLISKKKGSMALLLMSTLIYSIAILLTGSRMGIILLGINIILFIINLRKLTEKYFKKISYLIILVLVVICIIIFIQNYGKNLYLFKSLNRLTAYQRGESVNIRRFEILDLSKKIFRQRPYLWISGIGLGNFENFSDFYLGEPRATHNLYLELAISLGLGGLLLFLYFQFKLVLYTRKLLKYAQKLFQAPTIAPYYSVLFIIYIEYIFLTDLRVNKIIWVIYGTVCAAFKYSEKYFKRNTSKMPANNSLF